MARPPDHQVQPPGAQETRLGLPSTKPPTTWNDHAPVAKVPW